MPTQWTIDPKSLSPFSAPGVFMRIAPELEKQIEPYRQISERVSCCVQFCFQISHDQFDKANELSGRKHLRAALTEFVSIEEVAKGDFGREMPKILNLYDGRLHVLRLLRHANIHGKATEIEPFLRPAVWPGPDGDVEFNYIGYRIPNLMDEVKKSKQWNKYSPADLSSIVAWLEQDQSSWGIQNSIVRAAEQYVRILLR
ncbi:MAG: hypothetical protein L0Y43_04700 [Methylococcaceae bacterium]|nr:hypothetical protein [Methylococcaceae bacterium]